MNKLIIGPCVIEGEQWLVDVAGQIQDALEQVFLENRWVHGRDNPTWWFKASFDKANRTDGGSFRGPGFVRGVEAFHAVKKAFPDLKIITDVHSLDEIYTLTRLNHCPVDALQIPAFLCRQTDLVIAAAKTGKPVNIKKGQWMSPKDMKSVLDKALTYGDALSDDVWLCERGTFFGHGRLVVDMGGLPEMAKFGSPVIFDCTHSVQTPGTDALDGWDGSMYHNHTGGQRWKAPYLAKAAVATGVLDGLFMEAHPDPGKAKSDASTQLPITALEPLLTSIMELEAAL